MQACLANVETLAALTVALAVGLSLALAVSAWCLTYAARARHDSLRNHPLRRTASGVR